jgi:hypothetical protein
MSSTRRTAAQAAGLLLTGAVAGGVLAVTLGASASSPSPGTTGPTSYAATGPQRGGGPDGRAHFGATQAGTVTAVGAKSVTIKGNGAAKTYAVDANSDIDKNGEAKLSDLKAGDAVRFALRPGTSTIAVLHSGDEARDRPGGPCPGHHGDGDGDGPGGTQPSPVPTSAA